MILIYLNKAEKDRWLPQLFALFYENMSKYTPVGLSYEAEREEWLRNVSPALDKEPRQVLLALDGQKLAGFVMFYTRRELLMVEEFQIQKDYQGGLLFLRMCRKLLRDLPNEIQWVEAFAHRGNEHSRRLMERVGMNSLEEPDDLFLHLRGDARDLLRHLGYVNKKRILEERNGPLQS